MNECRVRQADGVLREGATIEAQVDVFPDQVLVGFRDDVAPSHTCIAGTALSGGAAENYLCKVR